LKDEAIVAFLKQTLQPQCACTSQNRLAKPSKATAELQKMPTSYKCASVGLTKDEAC
jgi:hypothetical protein